MCQHLCVIWQQWFHSPASREHKVLGLIPIGTNMSPIAPSVWVVTQYSMAPQLAIAQSHSVNVPIARWMRKWVINQWINELITWYNKVYRKMNPILNHFGRWEKTRWRWKFTGARLVKTLNWSDDFICCKAEALTTGHRVTNCCNVSFVIIQD